MQDLCKQLRCNSANDLRPVDGAPVLQIMPLNASFKDDTIKSLPSKSSRLMPFNLIWPLRVLNNELVFLLSCAMPLRLKPKVQVEHNEL